MARPAAAGPQLNGGGSGFAALEINQWQADTARHPYNLNINYVAQGSSVGRSNFASGLFDYGVSDVIYNPQDGPGLSDGTSTKRCGIPLKSCFRYVTVSAGGLSFMYNKPGLANLQLTQDEACKIFFFQITQWNDPELVATNPALAGDNSKIVVIVRADGAGESYVLSEYCKAVDPADWDKFRAAYPNDPALAANQPTSYWPQQSNTGVVQPVSGADGVATTVSDQTNGKNGITYDAAGYAKVRNFPVASVRNGSGTFTQPDEGNVTVALGYATGRGDGTFDLAFNGPDPRAYFPSTYSYVLAQTTGWDPAKGAVLGTFLCYAVGKGQTIAPPLKYARLSSAVVGISVSAITQIPGAPSASQCTAGAPAAPPPPQVLGGAGAAGKSGSGALGNGLGAGGAGSAGAGANGGLGAGNGAGLNGANGGQNAAALAALANGAGADLGNGLGNEANLEAALRSEAAEANKGGGPTTAEALAAIGEGMVLCAIVVGLVERRRRAAAG
jgi:ABC-type phosphate transport system substrate-binding protein